MQYSINTNDILLRLDPGDEIVKSILQVAHETNTTTAEISGIGATDDFEVGVFNMETKKYDIHKFTGNHEITNLCGSLSTMNAEAYQHLHITCANHEGECVGGHLLKAIISLTCEIFIRKTEGEISRKKNEDLGINQ